MSEQLPCSAEEIKVPAAADVPANPRPNALSMWSANSTNVAFTANTPRVIAASGFTVSADPKRNFAPNLATGEIVYTGHVPVWLRVTIDYSYNSLVPNSPQTLSFSIAKDRETSPMAKRKSVSFVPQGDSRLCEGSITDVIRLSRGESLQLAGTYTSTAMLVISNVSYAISEA